MSLEKDSGRSCWNCSCGLSDEQTRCPRCGIPAPIAAARQTASALPSSKAKRQNSTRRRAAIPLEARRAPSKTAPTRVVIIPPKPPAPAQRAEVGASAGGRLLTSFGVARRIGAAVTVASGRAANRAARLLSGTASAVSRGTSQLVAWRPRPTSGPTIDIDALRRENARTLANVAELLLRETREENDILKDRLARLEATVTGQDAGPVSRSAPVAVVRSSDPAPAATGRPKAGAARSSAKRGTTAKRRPRRSPAQQEDRVRDAAPIALAPDLEADLQDGGDPKVVRMEARRTGARRRRASSPAEAAS